MSRFLVVMTGVLILRGIAAQHLPAGLANSQMNPPIAYPNALLALKGGIVRFWNQVFYDQFIQMFTGHWITGG